MQCNYYDRSTELAEIRNHRDKSRLCLLFKIMQHQIRVPTDDILPPAPTIVTRSSHERNLLVPYARTNVYKHSFFPHTAYLWNKLQETIKATQSLDILKSRI